MTQINGFLPIASKALDGLYMRQLVIAHNIANANSPDFKPLRVNFEKALLEAIAQASENNSSAIDGVALKASRQTTEPGFRIDSELTKSSETALSYSTVIASLNKRLQMLSLVLTDGRG